jgi:hypothetical protein
MILRATSFDPVLLNKINILLDKGLKVPDLLLTAAFDSGPSVFIDTTRVPTTAEMAFVLKHLFNSGNYSISSFHKYDIKYIPSCFVHLKYISSCL